MVCLIPSILTSKTGGVEDGGELVLVVSARFLVSSDPSLIAGGSDVLVEGVTSRVQHLSLMLEVLPSLATSVGWERRRGVEEAIRLPNVSSAELSKGLAVVSVGLGGRGFE